ncbi:unnamed protein product [Ectocarpus sp. 8 AP-2014]
MVKLTVKTIKGKKFQIEVEQTQTVREVKGVIEEQNAEFPAAQLKLIHSGQILKDECTLAEYKIKEEEFLVCMVTKPKPAAAAPAAPAPAPSPAPATAAAAPAAAPAAPAVPAAPNADHVRQLTEMGFPEDQVTAALRAAMGNPDVAVEFLMTGIPDNIQAAAAPAQAAAAPTGAMETLEDFRGHPQFNELKRLVQRDPTQLSSILQMIGRQSPNLLARIHENQGDFIALMNEPIDESAPPPAAAGNAGSMGGFGPMMGSGGQANNPAQVAQLLQGMSPAQRAQMAAAMGMSPQQLAQVSQVIGQMPQEQFQQLMGSMNAGGMPGAGMGGMPPGAGGAGGNVIRLSEEEGAAVARLMELGFDRTDAAQAYLACDKNEALAANFLLNDMGAGMPPAFQAPAPVPAPPTAATPATPVPAPTPSSDSTAPSATETPADPSPTTGESSPTNPSADGNNPQGGGDEDEDMYG